MFHVQIIDPECSADYYVLTRELVEASFALTFHKSKGTISYRPQTEATEQVIYINQQGVESHIAQITNLTIRGVVRDRAEHF